MSSKFEYISSSVYVCRQPARVDPDDVDKCDCRENSEGPICFDSRCPNVATRKECVFCSRSRCQNQRLRACVWKNLEKFKASLWFELLPVLVAPSAWFFASFVCGSHRPLLQTGTSKDYGLRTLEPIAAGEFIIEYVGEVIDQVELDVRMREYSVRCLCQASPTLS